MAQRRRYRHPRKKTTGYLNFLIAFFLLFGAYQALFVSSHDNQNTAKSQQSRVSNQQISSSQSASSRASTTENAATAAKTPYGGLSGRDYDKLSDLAFVSGQQGYIEVNQNHATLIKNAWQTNRVIYANLDQLNRTSHGNTAFLEKRNVANDALRVRQYVAPTGWHYNRRNGTQLYNRGHLIAYSVSAGMDQTGHYHPDELSGDQNNLKNLFTQTAFSNQKLQTIFETKVRQALRSNKRVIYQATPIFKGNELMARGINLQAISTDGSLDFNVYIFNVQPGFQFNYADGRASVAHTMQVSEP